MHQCPQSSQRQRSLHALLHFKVVIGCINLVRTFKSNNDTIQERLQDFDFPEQLRIIGSTQFVLNVFNVVILLFWIVKMDVADQVHNVCHIDSVALHQFDAEVNVVQDRDNLAICFCLEYSMRYLLL